jgi:hypothetical protein
VSAWDDDVDGAIRITDPDTGLTYVFHVPAVHHTSRTVAAAPIAAHHHRGVESALAATAFPAMPLADDSATEPLRRRFPGRP